MADELLQENGDAVLLEDGGAILLESDTGGGGGGGGTEYSGVRRDIRGGRRVVGDEQAVT